jgi:hypothetical protein
MVFESLRLGSEAITETMKNDWLRDAYTYYSKAMKELKESMVLADNARKNLKNMPSNLPQAEVNARNKLAADAIRAESAAKRNDEVMYKMYKEIAEEVNKPHSTIDPVYINQLISAMKSTTPDKIIDTIENKELSVDQELEKAVVTATTELMPVNKRLMVSGIVAAGLLTIILLKR